MKKAKLEDDSKIMADWDREIEAEFQRTVSATKAAGARKQGERYVGAPWAFLVDVCRQTDGRSTLVVALCIYRRTYVQIVPVPVEIGAAGAIG
jgi:hypothetical protein